MNTKISRKELSRQAKMSQRGMTLVEIMVVIVIIGVVGGGVAFSVLGAMTRANEDTARTESCTIRSMVQLYVAQNAGQCPSLDDLKNGYLDAQRRTVDPWNNDFVIECESDSVDVYSTGKDGSGRIACGDEEEGE